MLIGLAPRYFTRAPRSFAGSILLLVSISTGAAGQPADGSDRTESLQQLESISARANDYELKARSWEHTSTIIVLLVLTVGTMGVAMSALQGYATTAGKIACVIMGILVGSITLVNSTLFPADHRTYSYSAFQVQSIIPEVRALIPRDPNTLSQQVLADRVTQGLQMVKQMKEFEQAIYRQWGSSQQAPVDKKGVVIPFAYAGVGTLETRRFEGIGESVSLPDARATAYTLAITKAAESLAREWSGTGRSKEIDPYSVRSFVEKIFDVVDERVSESGDQLIRCQVSIAVQSEFTDVHWSRSFGFGSSPPPLSSGEPVLVGIEPLGALQQDVQYWGVVQGEPRFVAPQRAAMVVLASAREDTSIEDGGSVRLTVGDRALVARGNLIAAQDRGGDVFTIKRFTGKFEPKVMPEGPTALLSRGGRILRDGEVVEISSGGRYIAIQGDRMVLSGLKAALRIQRVVLGRTRGYK